MTHPDIRISRDHPAIVAMAQATPTEPEQEVSDSTCAPAVQEKCQVIFGSYTYEISHGAPKIVICFSKFFGGQCEIFRVTVYWPSILQHRLHPQVVSRNGSCWNIYSQFDQATGKIARWWQLKD